MALSSELPRVLVIGDPGPTQEQISTALSTKQEFDLIGTIGVPDRLVREVRAAEPDIILVDSQLNQASTLDIIDDLALQFPHIPIISILPGDDPVRAQQVMLAGARAFLFQPFTQINLLSTLKRVHDLDERQRHSQLARPSGAVDTGRPVRTIAVFSPRGGVGSSTVAVNLALSMLEQTGQRVLLLEGKLFFGHLDVLLNLRPQNTIADLIPHAGNLDESLVHDVVTRHASGLDVLLAPGSVQVAQGIRPDDLYNIFTSLQKMYDLIVVDAGSSLNENTVTLMDSSDRILLITTPDLASLHDTSRFVQITRSLAYPAEKLLIVLNRSGMPGGVKYNDIENAMHHQLFAHIPDDDANALRSLNRGIPLVFRYPRSPASRAIKSLAKDLADLSLIEMAVKASGQATDKAHRDVLLATSRLG